MKTIQILTAATIITASLYAGYKYKEIGNTMQQHTHKNDTLKTEIKIKYTIDSAQWKYYESQRLEAEKEYKRQMAEYEKQWKKREQQMNAIIDEGLQIGREKKME